MQVNVAVGSLRACPTCFQLVAMGVSSLITENRSSSSVLCMIKATRCYIVAMKKVHGGLVLVCGLVFYNFHL